jgi:hypothetical protein
MLFRLGYLHDGQFWLQGRGNTMSNPYSTSYPDDAKYKQFICGRKDDVSRILDHLNRGQNIAMFGERRIGKSLLLWLVRDIINGEIDVYRNSLVDLDLKDAIDMLKAKVPAQWKAIYINLLPEEEKTSKIEALTSTIQKELMNVGLLCPSPLQTMRIPIVNQTSIASHYKTITDVFHALCNSPGNNQFIILFDEMGTLLGYPESLQIAYNLRFIMQSYSRIHMVFAGAEEWYYQIKEKTLPLVYSLVPYYVTLPTRSSVENYLVKEQLSKCLPPIYDGSEMFRTIIDWTGGKAFYVQVVCLTITEKYNRSGSIPDDWQQIIKKHIFDSWWTIISDFYAGNNLNTLTKNILALVANKPNLTVKGIARKLGNSEKVVSGTIHDLVLLDKVEERAGKYCIVGTAIAEYGRLNHDIPAIKSRWPQPSKLAIICIILLLAAFMGLFAYPYSHPDSLITTFRIPGGKIYIELPTSLEQDETGKIKVTIQDIGNQKIPITHVFLDSSKISYTGDNGTNQLDFPEITVNQQKSLTLNYTVDATGNFAFISFPSRQITSQLIVIQDKSNFSAKYSFARDQRYIAVQKWWGIFSVIFALFAGGIPLIARILDWWKGKEEKGTGQK